MGKMDRLSGNIRSLEFHEGTSDKFWTITLRGFSHIVQFGRKGTKGQEQRKEFESADAARNSFEKLIAEKLKKGYHDVEGPSVFPDATPVSVSVLPAIPPTGSERLRTALTALDAYLKRNAPDTYRSLRRGASERDLAKLSERVFGGGALPPDLYEWFSWHHGQKDRGLRLLIDRTFVLTTIPQAVETCEAYRESTEDWAEPWDKSWVPVMDNGAGDYLCYAPSSGKVFEFWHDEMPNPSSSESFKSLIDLAESAVKMYQAANKGPDPLNFAWDLSKATPLTEIDYQTVFKAPQGTTFYGGPAGPKGKYFVAVNGPQQWVVKWAGSQEEAFKTVKAQADMNDIKTSLGTSGVVWQVELLVKGGRAWTVMATITGR